MSEPHVEDDELLPSQTTGYKVGEKKTVDELKNLDAADESLNKWKASLGLGNAITSPPDDPRKVVITGFGIEVEGRQDVMADLSSPEKIEAVKKNVFTLKEGSQYRLKIQFKIQHEVVSGLKYLQVVKRAGIRVDKIEEMIGSYGPSPNTYERKFTIETVPSGMFVRGTYDVRSRFIDDDGVPHVEWDWKFQIKKDWE